MGLLFVLALAQSIQPAQSARATEKGQATEVPQAADLSEPPHRVLTRAPELVKFVEAIYPPEALGAGVSGAVELDIFITADGQVSDVRVVDSGPYAAFVPAALAATRQFEFTPAEVDGKPEAMTVRYRYEFVLHPPAPKELVIPAVPAVATPSAASAGSAPTGPAPISSAPTESAVPAQSNEAPVVLAGRVIERGTRSPVNGALVAAGETWVQTTADGRFELRGLPPGPVKIRILSGVHQPLDVEETIEEGKRKEVEYRVTCCRADAYETVVRTERDRRDASVRNLQSDEMRLLPGTQGDVLKVVQNFPGVARAPFGIGQLIVRGSAPADTKVYLDGVEIPLAYHFGGLSSVVSGDVLSGLDFYPGNFDARFGRAMGGTIDQHTRDPRHEFHGDAQLDAYSGSLMLEGPVGAGSAFVTARRGWIDQALNLVLSGQNSGYRISPVYGDYQAKLVEPLFGGTLTLMAVGSDDTFHFLQTRSTGSQPTFDLHTTFHRLVLGYEHPLGNGLAHRTTVALGYDLQSSRTNTTADASVEDTLVSLRDAFVARWSDSLSLEAGLDVQAGHFTYDLFLPATAPQGAIPDPEQVSQSAHGAGWAALPAAYLEARWQLARLRLVPSLRLEGYSYPRWHWDVDPRLAAFYDLVPGTALTAGAGLYSEAPQNYQLTNPIGNPRLGFQRALHYSAGVLQDLPWSAHLDVTGFYKDLRNLVTPTRALAADGTPLRLANTGRGEVIGLEVLARRELAHGLFGWLAYTLSRSLRRDDSTTTTGQFYHLDAFDQTHDLTLVLSYRTENDWSFGARVRYTSGDPYTPFVNRIFDTDAGRYRCIPGAVNSRRLAPFFQADVRADKRWTFDDWIFAAYLDVQNVTNRANPELTVASGDCSESVAITGLPILPTLGLRAEW